MPSVGLGTSRTVADLKSDKQQDYQSISEIHLQQRDPAEGHSFGLQRRCESFHANLTSNSQFSWAHLSYSSFKGTFTKNSWIETNRHMCTRDMFTCSYHATKFRLCVFNGIDAVGP